MMAAASSGVRALTKGDAKSWLIFKCIVAVFCAPLAVFMELHAFDKVALILYGISTLLWLFGWLPGELRGGSHAGGDRSGRLVRLIAAQAGRMQALDEYGCAFCARAERWLRLSPATAAPAAPFGKRQSGAGATDAIARRLARFTAIQCFT